MTQEYPNRYPVGERNDLLQWLEERIAMIRALRRRVVTGDPAAMRLVEKLYDKENPLRPFRAHCDDCGAFMGVRAVSTDPWGKVHWSQCQACYHETPEPDTGRPDFTDLPLMKGRT